MEGLGREPFSVQNTNNRPVCAAHKRELQNIFFCFPKDLSYRNYPELVYDELINCIPKLIP